MANITSKLLIRNDSGEYVEALAPIIVSASRSTDIPAFYVDWFFERLKRGYSVWINPFNGVRSYISYDKTRFIVFWSKNPRPLLKHLNYLDERNISSYIQYTLNDYEEERLEKGVPPLSQRVETFKLLVDRLGKGRVIWRFDPMILTDKINMDKLLAKVKRIGNQLKGYTEKLVFSYADIATYVKVKANLEKNCINYIEWDTDLMIEFASRLSEMNRVLGWNFKLATCGEKVDLGQYGIEHNRCVDDDLIIRFAYKDKVLMDYLKVEINTITTKQPSLFDDFEEPNQIPDNAIMLTPDLYAVKRKNNKDNGQRQLCGCIVSKDIGQYNTCPHLCEYCYANTSKETATLNWERHNLNHKSETVTGQ